MLNAVCFDEKVDTRDFDPHEVYELFEMAEELAAKGQSDEALPWWKLADRRFDVTGIPEQITRDGWIRRLDARMLRRRKVLQAEVSACTDETKTVDLRRQVETWTTRIEKLRVASRS